MTDEELIARLRDWEEHDEGKINDAREDAAARIKAQAAEIERLRDALAKAVEERDEAIRRRDAWKAKAEGYDAVRKALREKVGAPWPPNLSRALWAGLAADEKKRADDAEAKLAKAEVINGLLTVVAILNDPNDERFPESVDLAERFSATLAEIKGAKP